jgi:hypothetical protein
MPHHMHSVLVHTMSGNELSRVRTELSKLPIVQFSPPHPVQPNGQLASHRYLRNALFPTHRQVKVTTTQSESERINRSTSGRFFASCSTAVVNSSMVGVNRSSNSVKSCRRRLAQGANGNFSNSARPCSLHSFFFQRFPRSWQWPAAVS